MIEALERVAGIYASHDVVAVFAHGGVIRAAVAEVLDRVNVLIVPRANPDGADLLARNAEGYDVNRDHLLGMTPEGRALGRVLADYEPDVVLDGHGFRRGHALVREIRRGQRYDVIQYATVSNLRRRSPKPPTRCSASR